jgi:hypothetical protein
MQKQLNVVDKTTRPRRIASATGCIFDSCLLLWRTQDDFRDLGGGAEAHGRAPKARSATDVELRVTHAVVASDERLLQTDERSPRPDLSAVGVP